MKMPISSFVDQMPVVKLVVDGEEQTLRQFVGVTQPINSPRGDYNFHIAGELSIQDLLNSLSFTVEGVLSAIAQDSKMGFAVALEDIKRAVADGIKFALANEGGVN